MLKPKVELPLSDLRRMLCLENDAEAERFVTHYGLELVRGSSGPAVYLTGSGYLSPATDEEA